jgi:hypothetical protein
MISGPLVADLATPAGPWTTPRSTRARATTITLAGVALLASAVIGLVAWAIFVSPLGFSRYPLSDQDRTFTIHRAGTYVVYFEFPGESRAALPPALDVRVVPLSGQEVDVHPIGSPGVEGAPNAYDLAGHEGRAVAEIVAHRAGTFVVSITPVRAAEVDTSQQRIVTEGTIALGREWSRTWLATWFGFVLVVVMPILVGAALVVVGRHQRVQASDDR